jgi:hypothetical protein
MNQISSRLKSLGLDESGSVLVEFAVSIPFLMILLLGVVELGGYIWQRLEVNSATEAGLMYATKNGWCTGAGCGSNTGSQISSAAMNAGVGNVTSNPSPSCFYGCPSNASPFTIGQQAGRCGIDTPPTCGDGYAARQYVTFGAKLPRASFITGGTGIINLRLPDNITETAVVRVK